MLVCGIAFGQDHFGDTPSPEVIKELMAHLPNGIKTGNQLTLKGELGARETRTPTTNDLIERFTAQGGYDANLHRLNSAPVAPDYCDGACADFVRRFSGILPRTRQLVDEEG